MAAMAAMAPVAAAAAPSALPAAALPPAALPVVGGDGGGLVVAEGTPETVAGIDGSHTGSYLARLLKKAK